ncbi:MAG TPA: hypothetical protein VEK33_07385 [Terriglobales bacterium]|nr:hypothetical protein [Terriglobales bacterium]
MIPIRADVLKGKPERRALSGSEGGGAQIDGIRIGAAGPEHLEWKVFDLDDLIEGVFELDMHGGVSDSLVARVRDRPINVGNAGADKVLRLAHFQIGKLHRGGVGMRDSRSGRFSAREQNDKTHHDDDNGHAEEDGAQVGVARRFTELRWFDQPTHGAIVDG